MIEKSNKILKEMEELKILVEDLFSRIDKETVMKRQEEFKKSFLNLTELYSSTVDINAELIRFLNMKEKLLVGDDYFELMRDIYVFHLAGLIDIYYKGATVEAFCKSIESFYNVEIIDKEKEECVLRWRL